MLIYGLGDNRQVTTLLPTPDLSGPRNHAYMIRSVWVCPCRRIEPKFAGDSHTRLDSKISLGEVVGKQWKKHLFIWLFYFYLWYVFTWDRFFVLDCVVSKVKEWNYKPSQTFQSCQMEWTIPERRKWFEKHVPVRGEEIACQNLLL